MSRDAKQILKQVWGYDAFRPLQEPIISAVLEGKDTFALLPTGGGKSICYQVPGLVNATTALVISPLIALMQDQVHQLESRGVQAKAIYSGLYRREIESILQQAINNDLSFLYVSPERLKTDLFLQHFKEMNLSLIAVDEAHCISQWGHDFRPAYREISEIRKWHPNVPVIALTATATPQVKDDIIEQLELKSPQVFQKTFRRDNLNWVAIEDVYEKDRMQHIMRRVKGSSIVYTQSRQRTAELAKYLKDRGFKALYYHAGLSSAEREKRQKLWIQNHFPHVVSTNAFGMGVDKADVRKVIHLDIPQGPEEYYQEAGRAGRDGKQAFAAIVFDQSKIEQTEKRILRQFPSPDFCAEVYDALNRYFKIAYGSGKDAVFPIQLGLFCEQMDLPVTDTYYALKLIQQSGWVNFSEDIHTHSKMHIPLARKELYELQVRYKEIDIFIKTVLRMYEGLFIDFVSIDERKIAQTIGISKEEIIRFLKKLSDLNAIVYLPAYEGGQICFLEGRVAKERFRINRAYYHERKQIALERWNAMKNYLLADRCRTNILLEYFGEKPSSDCGNCDICLGSKTTHFSKEEMPLWIERIKRSVRKNSNLTVRDLLKCFPYNVEKRILNLLKFLEEEERIAISNQQTVQWVSES